jgi:polar amino acid transport system substrate-binding protein
MVGSRRMARFEWRSGAIPSAVALALAVIAVACPSVARADALSDIRQRGELTWGGDLQGGAPYVFEDARSPDHLRGFEVDIARALGRRIGVRARFVQNDWSSLIPGLERGDFDLLLNGLEDTPARRERLLLTVPYFVYGETLAVAKSSRYTSLADLAGQRVGTLNQTVAHELLKTRGVEIVLYEGQQEPYFDLAHGRVQGVLLDHVIAEIYGCPLPEVRCLPGDVARGVYVAAVRKNAPELARALDAAIAAMIADGELRRILESYRLWDSRQDELALRARRTSAPAGDAAAAPRHFDLAQALLFLRGAVFTLLISLGSFAIALPLGLLLAILRGFGSRPWSLAAAAYVEVFRGTPVLLQLYVLYFGLAPLVRLGPFEAAMLGLGLNYAAYEAEVHRGALLALPRGQTEAARSLGLSSWQALRYVLLPQSFRNALPALTNDFVSLLKDSSLVSVITVVELTKRMTIAAADLRNWVIPGIACAALYFALSFPLSRLALRLERGLSHDSHPRPA